MADGKVVIETDLDEKGIEQGLSKLQGLVNVGMTAVVAAIATATAALGAMGGYAIKAGSDFEAGMSKVAAISGATGGDLDALTNKAKEMGAKTKFSATEASEAFSYMAMAGWKTGDMLSGIEGIMNLAAASGEDLASTSDIVTDALTAFGLQASDSAHFADVLAAASSNSNTNVGLMGATFKYVAPIAGAMGYSIEDTAVAIGLMANAGIKGEQAGTNLRAMLTRLSSPTAETAKAMEDLKISITDADGTIKPFNEVLEQLRNSFANLDDSQKTQYASALAGQEAMSGLLAIVGASDSDFATLVGAINGADGAAQDMAETMQDNLQGKLTILKSSIEGFGIQIYESMETPLKSATETGIDSIGRLSDAFASGGLKGAVDAACDMFGDFIESVAESDTTLGNILKPIANVTKAGMNLAKSVLPPVGKGFKFCADNLDILLPLLTSGVAAFEGYKIVGTVSKLMTGYKSVLTGLTAMEKANALQLVASAGGLTLKEKAVGILTGKITLATVAQTAWNAVLAANPIGLVVTAIGALAAGIGVYSLVTGGASDATRMFTDEEEKLHAAIDKEADALKERQQAREEAITGLLEESAHTEALANELRGIVDENGRVQEGYEARAAFITSTLSEALGLEIELIDGQIQGYQELAPAIDEVIEKKKAEAVLNAYEADYQEAVKKKTEALKDWLSVSQDLKAAQEELSEAQVEQKAFIEENGVENAKLTNEIDTLTQKVKELTGENDKASASYADYNNTIKTYEGLSAAIIEGDASKIEAAVAQIEAGYRDLNTQSEAELSQTVITTSENMAALGEAIASGAMSAKDAGVSEMANLAAGMLGELAELPGGAAAHASEIDPAMLGALANLPGTLSEESKAAVLGFLEGLDGVDEETRKKFEQAVQGAVEGADGDEQLKTKADELGGSYLEALAQVLQVHSPSRAVKEIFAQVVPGAMEGVDQGKEGLLEKGASIASDFLASLSNGGLIEGAQNIGISIMSAFGLGVTSQIENSRAAGAFNSEAANSGAGSIDPTGTGINFGTLLGNGVSAMAGLLFSSGSMIGSSSEYGFGSINPTGTGMGFGTMLGNGVASMAGLLFGTGSTIGNSAELGAGSINPTRTGEAFGSQYSSGVGSKSGSANREGRNLADNANVGAGSADGYNPGSDFGAGFVNGIGAWLGSAANAAANLAISAYNALRSALDEHSPSRKAKMSGKNFDLGFAGGIKDNEKEAIKAADSMAANTLDVLEGLDVSAIADKMRFTVATEQAAMSSNITAKVTRLVETKYEGANTKDDFVESLSARLSVDIVSAFVKAGVTVVMDKREVGKLIAPEIDKNLRVRKV